MLVQKKCSYCDNSYIKDEEHVFPYGLGGQDIFMDCVCKECNKNFSALEGELYGKSPIALMRSNAGIMGYKKYDRNKPAPFKAPILVTFDEGNNIVFEVGQFYPMEIFIRPQLMLINGCYYLGGETDEGLKEFAQKFKKLRTNNLKIIRNDPYGFIEFDYLDTYYSVTHKTGRVKKANGILFCSLTESYEHYSFLHPRIFIDDEKNLKVRAKTIDEAIAFIEGFLNHLLSHKEFSSFKKIKFKDPTIYVSLNFDPVKAERALIKIGLNCLMHYYPNTKNEVILNDYISYVQEGKPFIRLSMDRKNDTIDSKNNTHNIFFYQHQNSVEIRISLFNGQFAIRFIVDNLKILRQNEYNRLVIDYKKRINKFENRPELQR
jgi:uncharacterized Zn-finger protein